MLTEAMLTLTSYIAMECKYRLLSQGASPINAVCGKPVWVPPSYHLHADKHLHRGLHTAFFQKEICLGEKKTARASPEECPCVTTLHGLAPNLPYSCALTWTRDQDIHIGNSQGGRQLRKRLQKGGRGWEDSWVSGTLENHQHKGR